MKMKKLTEIYLGVQTMSPEPSLSPSWNPPFSTLDLFSSFCWRLDCSQELQTHIFCGFTQPQKNCIASHASHGISLHLMCHLWINFSAQDITKCSICVGLNHIHLKYMIYVQKSLVSQRKSSLLLHDEGWTPSSQNMNNHFNLLSTRVSWDKSGGRGREGLSPWPPRSG